MPYTRKQFKSEEEWLKNRLIGGSGASKIVGENTWQSNVEYYHSIIDRLDGKETADKISNERAIRIGKQSEEPLLRLFEITNFEEYEVIYPKTIEKDGFIEMLVSEKNPFMTATLDGELIEKSTGRKGFYEGKTATLLNLRSKEKWGKENIPINYYYQLLHYFIVKDDAEFAVLNALLIFSDDYKIMRTYKIERKDIIDQLAYLEEEEVNFWQKNILPRKEPNILIKL